MVETFQSTALGHIFFFTDEISEADMKEIRIFGLLGDIIVIHGALLSLLADQPDLHDQLLEEFPTPIRPEGKDNHVHIGTSTTNRTNANELAKLLPRFETERNYETFKLGFLLLKQMYDLVLEAAEPPFQETPQATA